MILYHQISSKSDHTPQDMTSFRFSKWRPRHRISNSGFGFGWRHSCQKVQKY